MTKIMTSSNFKYEKNILENFQCILKSNYSFYGGLFFNFYFDIIMTYFESTFFIFYVWQT